MFSPDVRSRDLVLVDRCLAGDHAAWAEMFAEYQNHLVRVACWAVSRPVRKSDLPQEFVQQMWVELVTWPHKHFDRFKKRHTDLRSFLSWLVRQRVRRYFFFHGRRKRLEFLVARALPSEVIRLEVSSEVEQAEFARTLPRRQLQYFEAQRGGRTPDLPFSEDHSRQLTCRILKRWNDFHNGS